MSARQFFGDAQKLGSNIGRFVNGDTDGLDARRFQTSSSLIECRPSNGFLVLLLLAGTLQGVRSKRCHQTMHIEQNNLD